jgi:tRNA dimethylallyltransferase
LPRPPEGDRERSSGPPPDGPEAPPRLRLLVVVGPTGTGKTDLAVELGTRLPGEVVACDALQVYRGLDAATGKPSREQRRIVPHHLLDVLDPSRDATMADWVLGAEAAISGIARRARVPIVTGGTGLYLRGLLRGVLPAPARDAVLRARLGRIAHRRGPRTLHSVLSRRDPASAARLTPADTQRLVRALELAWCGGRTWSERLAADGSWRDGRERYDALKVGLALDRAELARRLDARVDRFFADGLVDEVRRLRSGGLAAGANALRAIGYREVSAALDAGRDPDAVRAEVRIATRRYAKRQLTWFRAEPGIVWLDAARPLAALAAEVERRWHERR